MIGEEEAVSVSTGDGGGGGAKVEGVGGEMGGGGLLGDRFAPEVEGSHR